jgi:hypothetical protein
MLQLQNNTPFAADFALFPNEDGIDTLYVIVKASFNIGQQWSLTDLQANIIQAEEYWSDPESSSVKYPSDFHPGKLCSDVIMNGSAFAPQGKAVQQLDVSLKVGKVAKKVIVFGDRQWQGSYISQPIPFQMMPLVYERAYGGQYSVNEEVFAQENNPVGLGFVGKRTKAEVNGLPLPNLENPDSLITSIKDQPQPACFAAIAPYWAPRSHFAGTYDEKWQKTCAPFLPEDFDKRFCNVASSGLVYPEYLQGGELVEITNMHTQGNLTFTIPHVKLNAEVSMANIVMKPKFNLETLLLEPNDLTINMVWRAAVACDKKTKKITTIKINMAR